MGASVTLWEATAPVKLPPWPCLAPAIRVARLDATSAQEWYFTVASPHAHKRRLHRLPPILRRRGLAPRPGCSKAPRGLFVLSRVTRIFTGTSISPSPPSRQCSSRYAFRAGRNLPDKEFRYLRTVIVTAAVHRGFSSRLRTPLPLTFRHWAGISPYTSACAFAETCVFGKQSLGPAPCGPLTPSEREVPRYATRAPLLPKLRGQFAEFLNGGSLVHLGVTSPCPPVSVCGTGGVHVLTLEAFLGGLRITRTSAPSSGARRARLSGLRDPDLPGSPAYTAPTGPVHSAG